MGRTVNTRHSRLSTGKATVRTRGDKSAEDHAVDVAEDADARVGDAKKGALAAIDDPVGPEITKDEGKTSLIVESEPDRNNDIEPKETADSIGGQNAPTRLEETDIVDSNSNADTGGEDAQLKRKDEQKGRTAVVYVSRVPPGMDVGALRAMLGRTGKLGRVWLRPEDAERRKERRALGGARRRGEFQDGWVEFRKRSQAKKAVALLNGQPMAGAKRRGRWADDLWCLKLLKGFTWENLVEETCGTTRERTLRVKAEIAAARREKAFVEERASLAHKLGLQLGDDEERPVIRRFRQKRVIEQTAYDDDVDERRAKEAQERVDAEVEGKAPATPKLDSELLGMLFKKRRRD